MENQIAHYDRGLSNAKHCAMGIIMSMDVTPYFSVELPTSLPSSCLHETRMASRQKDTKREKN